MNNGFVICFLLGSELFIRGNKLYSDLGNEILDKEERDKNVCVFRFIFFGGYLIR